MCRKIKTKILFFGQKTKILLNPKADGWMDDKGNTKINPHIKKRPSVHKTTEKRSTNIKLYSTHYNHQQCSNTRSILILYIIIFRPHCLVTYITTHVYLTHKGREELLNPHPLAINLIVTPLCSLLTILNI